MIGGLSYDSDCTTIVVGGISTCGGCEYSHNFHIPFLLNSSALP